MHPRALSSAPATSHNASRVTILGPAIDLSKGATVTHTRLSTCHLSTDHGAASDNAQRHLSHRYPRHVASI
jgi:hypothetical protein